MASRTNVNDRHFLDDLAYNEDYRRDVNAAEQAVREAAADICGPGAVIFNGLEVSPGTTPGYLKVSAGRARDKDKYHILVPSEEDDVGPGNEGDNYVAIRHKWSGSSAGNAVKTGRPYNRVRVDSYEIDISVTRHDEADGWVNLAFAVLVPPSTWTFAKTSYPNRSRGPARGVAFWTFTYPGLLENSTVGALMYHHGLNKDVFAVPFDLVIHRLTFNAKVPGDGDISFALYDPVTSTWKAFAVPAGVQLPLTFFDDFGFIAYDANDKLKVALTNESGMAGPTDITVVVAGYRVGD